MYFMMDTYYYTLLTRYIWIRSILSKIYSPIQDFLTFYANFEFCRMISQFLQSIKSW